MYNIALFNLMGYIGVYNIVKFQQMKDKDRKIFQNQEN